MASHVELFRSPSKVETMLPPSRRVGDDTCNPLLKPNRCRIQRDVADRGRDVAGVIEQYTKFVKPAFDTYVAPSRKHADVIIPWARGDNAVAIDLITEHIRMKLQQHDLRRIYTNLEIIPSNYQVGGWRGRWDAQRVGGGVGMVSKQLTGGRQVPGLAWSLNLMSICLQT